MNPQDAIDLSREAIKTCMMVGGPILIASLLIGLVVGALQAMTQVQDQTVSFVPKILLLALTIGICLPWLTEKMIDFAHSSFEKPLMMSTSFHPSEPSSRNGIRTAALPERESRDQPNKTNPHQPNPTTQSSPPLASPFELPHYQYSRPTHSDLGG